MKQPRVTQDILVLDNVGDIVTVSRSIALEGAPKGQAKFGPIGRCPITSEVLYESDMTEYRGSFYSPEGLQEVIERDRLRTDK